MPAGGGTGQDQTDNQNDNNGGTAETDPPVLLELTFTNADQPSVVKVFDFGQEGLDPVRFVAEVMN